MNEVRNTSPGPMERLREGWRATRLWIVFAAGLIGVTASISLPISLRQSSFGLEVGDVAPQDVLAPYPLSFSSSHLTEEARQAASSSVSGVYDPPSAQVARDQLDSMEAAFEFIDSVRADELAERDQKLADLQSLASIDLREAEANAVLDLSPPRWEDVKSEANNVLEQVIRTEIRPDRLDQARRTIPALIRISLPSDQAELVVSLVRAFVAPNSFLNEEATESARTSAAASVSPVIISFAAGETIVSRGEVVTESHLEALEQYGLLNEPEPWRQVAYRGLLVTLLGFSLALFAYRVHPEKIRDLRLAGLLTVLFVAFAFAMQVMIPGRTVLPYLFPTATLPMILAVLFGPGMALMAALISGALVGFLGPRGLELGLYVALSGVMGSLMIGKAERLSSFFWAGLAASLAAVSVVVVFRFPDPATDVVGKATLMGSGIVSGLISASLAFGLLLLIGSLLGITTNLQLLELARPDHPLLQYILINAPGTYQHSLQVANLAEQAARAIGANPLLTRVGALYHDAGKALRPQFFIENQMPGQNIHQTLDPTTSASIIVGHVKDGLDLARKHRIPKAVRDFIPEHHGRLEASYQYQQAVEAVDGDESKVDRSEFMYPGPRPRSRETALLMLADGVEAKARSETPKEEDDIDSIVRWVIQDRLNAGQLDRTDLTLRDLDTVRRSFANTLRGMYHPRIRYPGEPETEEPLLIDEGATQPQLTSEKSPTRSEAG